MSFSIRGLGTAVPEHTMSQPEATALAEQVCCQSEEQARLLRVLYRKAGVKNRHTVLPHRIALDWVPAESRASGDCFGPTTLERMQFYEEHAYPLSRRAAELALADAAWSPREITHLITVTCTGFVAPGVDIDLIRHLKLPPTTERIQVGFMGCHGAINGLRVAQAITTADPQARVLLCAIELCSLHYRFQWDPERFIGNALFADGAAAIVGHSDAAGDGRAWSVRSTGSCLLPESTEAMGWRIGDHGFEMTLSPRVPELIGQHLRPWLSEWLARYDLTIETVGCWAIHPGGPRIVSAVEESLGLGGDASAPSREVLADYGNMSSPTVLFIFDRLRRAPAAGPCLALGFGPGLVAEAALLDAPV